MWRTSLFSSYVTMISYFNIIINISIITNLTFSRVLKIYNIFFSHHKFFFKMFFHRITVIFTFLNRIINKIVNYIFALVYFKRLTKLIINTYHFTAITATNKFLIFICIRLIQVLFSIILLH